MKSRLRLPAGSGWGREGGSGMKRHLSIAAATLCALLAINLAAPFAGAATGSKKVKACDLLTVADVESEFGVTGVGPDPQAPSDDPESCRYAWTVTEVSGNTTTTTTGTASVNTGKVDASIKRDIKKNLKEDGFSKIPGVKKGFVHPEGGEGPGSWILAVQGKKFVSIQLGNVDVTKQQLVKLMKQALKRL
jgi:hypothetical protein